jgi:hypothetical protein
MLPSVATRNLLRRARTFDKEEHRKSSRVGDNEAEAEVIENAHTCLVELSLSAFNLT